MWNPFKKKEKPIPEGAAMLQPRDYDTKVVFIGKYTVQRDSNEFASSMQYNIQEACKGGYELKSVTCNSLNEFYAFLTK